MLFSKRKLRFSGRSGAFSAALIRSVQMRPSSFGRIGDQLAGNAANRLSWPAPIACACRIKRAAQRQTVSSSPFWHRRGIACLRRPGR